MNKTTRNIFYNFYADKYFRFVYVFIEEAKLLLRSKGINSIPTQSATMLDFPIRKNKNLYSFVCTWCVRAAERETLGQMPTR